jgi:acetyltransferase-like isoleucine patch superfamily enzyme
MKPRLIVACMLAILPNRVHRLLGRLLLGWEVDRTAYIGHSVIAAKKVVMGPSSAIGSFNVIKGLEEINLAEGASIGFFNWISGPPLGSGAFPKSPGRRPALIMGTWSTIVQRHLIDCTDTITMGDYSTVGGWRSTVLTHSVNLVRNQQFAAPITIGERSAVMSNSILLAGTTVPPMSVISAGSVVNSGLTKPLTFYRGNPAVAVRELSDQYAFFQRTGPAE